MSQFTWLPFFEELLSVICEKYDKISLVDVFYSIFSDAGGIEDHFSDGTTGQFKEVDPLTFIAYFNRNNTDEKRISYCAKAKEKLELMSDVPQDFSGIPYFNPQNTWFLGWEKNRDPKAVDILWDFGKQLNTDSIEPKLFTDALNIKYVGISKLTQILFICKPNLYLSFDKRNRSYLKEMDIETKQIIKQLKSTDGFINYQKFLATVHDVLKKPFHEISHDAYLYEPPSPPPSKEVRYWMIAPGKQAVFWEEWQEKGIITIGWDKTGDLSAYSSKDEIQQKMQQIYGDDSSQKNSALACYEFANVMKPNDIVIVKTGSSELMGYGIVLSDYEYDNTRPKHHNVRKVNWKTTGEWSYSFKENDIKRFVLKTLTDITKYKDFPQQLIEYMESENPPSVCTGTAYWWLNANPKIWDISKVKIGEKQTYTTRNDKGNKRRIYKHFKAVKPGDIVLGYVSTPDKEITTICQITKPIFSNNGKESIEFKVIETIANPVSYDELKSVSDLSNCEPLINNQGSLFKVTENEYEIIRDMIDSKNLEEEPPEPYSIDQALEGLFFEREEFEDILEVLRFKKNIILQGAPGVGKTYIAKRLAYSLMEQKAPRRVQMIQFHQSYSYEDFIQGYRPNDKENFTLKNGVFYDFCKKAQRDPDNNYIFIIDEINRGNLSKIFGELMMLVEPDKRGKEFAVPLTYALEADEKFYIPINLYLVGTMNTADRSLAMVDYALRRRFSFISLSPKYKTSNFREYLTDQNISKALIDKIVYKMVALNEKIAKDEKNLGAGYQIGHSFFCPSENHATYDDQWYRRVVLHEIKPLLEEYWFDDQDGVERCVKDLLE